MSLMSHTPAPRCSKREMLRDMRKVYAKVTRNLSTRDTHIPGLSLPPLWPDEYSQPDARQNSTKN